MAFSKATINKSGLSSKIFGHPSFNPNLSEISVSEVENLRLCRFVTKVEALKLAAYFKDLHGYLSSGRNLTKFFLSKFCFSFFSSSSSILLKFCLKLLSKFVNWV